MKLAFKLSGNQFECTIGHSLLIAASSAIKQGRHDAFRATMAILGEQGSTVDTKESAISLLQDHIKTQIPDDQEVRAWLQTFDGQKFALVHGTQKMPLKLTQETADQVLDEMSNEDHDKLVFAISDLCFGTEMTEINRQSEKEFLEISKLRLERLKTSTEEFKQEAEAIRLEAEAKKLKPTTSAQGEDTLTQPATQT